LADFILTKYQYRGYRLYMSQMFRDKNIDMIST